MNINYCEQRSQEWYDLRKGKIGGTRFGQVISGRKNRLVYDLLNETLSEAIYPDDYISEEMQFGIDNEDDALELYSQRTGIKVIRVGAILSDFSGIHLASPDGLSEDHKIVQEVKCTEDGGIHIQRFFEGTETSYIPQIANYFAVSDEVERVDWISYCPSRPERPIIIRQFYRESFVDMIKSGRSKIKQIESELNGLKDIFLF